MYGWQWRHFNAEYEGSAADYTGKGIDQLEKVIAEIKEMPHSRRILMTSYNPADAKKGVLYPCHGLTIQFYCNGGKLTCMMYQRSMDLFLGAPYNFVSYALLTHLIAKQTDMVPDKLIIFGGDVHIYSNLVEQCKLQSKRSPYPFPRIQVLGEKKKIGGICVQRF